jgi:hypothetical protein
MMIRTTARKINPCFISLNRAGLPDHGSRNLERVAH